MDNVLVALTNLSKGQQVEFEGKVYELLDDVEAKHKFLTEDLSKGSEVNMYGVLVGKVQEDLKNTELSLNLAFENAKTQISNSIITLNNQKENVELAQEVYDNTRNNYNQGLAPLTDLLDAENSLTTAQNNYSSALLDYRLAEIQLIKSQGNLK